MHGTFTVHAAEKLLLDALKGCIATTEHLATYQASAAAEATPDNADPRHQWLIDQHAKDMYRLRYNQACTDIAREHAGALLSLLDTLPVEQQALPHYQLLRCEASHSLGVPTDVQGLVQLVDYIHRHPEPEHAPMQRVHARWLASVHGLNETVLLDRLTRWKCASVEEVSLTDLAAISATNSRTQDNTRTLIS
jgi:hypothetical protein